MQNAAALTNEIDCLKLQLVEKENRISLLEGLIKQFQHKLFAPSSEKVSVNQLSIFNEAEADEATDDIDAATHTTVAAHQRSKRKRLTLPPDIPCEEIIYDIPEQDKVCPHDGSALKVIDSDDHKQLDIIPAQLKVLLHRRLKYACPCCDQHIITAKKPKQPIEKSIASPGLLATVATQKYCDALPLYRQSEIFKRLGIDLDRTNLANWMVRCGDLVQPLINLLLEHICAQPVVHLDETTNQVLNEPGKTAQSKSYMWLTAAYGQQSAIVFRYDATRSERVPLDILDHTVSTIMVDGYVGYAKACSTYSITRLGCWAHARRKFVEAKQVQPKGKTGKADQALAFIQKLYAIEKQIKDHPPDQRQLIRAQQAKPIIDKLRQWLEKSVPAVPPSTALGKALTYLHNQWDCLVRYLDDGHYPIDNNKAENSIRPFAIGRKNWLFANSQAGAKASANLYSLIETAKRNQLNPLDYLKTVFTQLPNAQSVEDIEKLLPWNIDLS
ncbi:MAG: IS66 family transposase [Gammaproteobacteria bacterium]|nr:IS66 family transposase [Gammaproteobacteria bacterium]